MLSVKNNKFLVKIRKWMKAKTGANLEILKDTLIWKIIINI